MRINFNPISSIANIALFKNNRGLNKVTERLSTGLRINRASDDASGLSLSEKMRAQIRGVAQAQENVQNAIGLFQIEEGIVGQAQNCLQRIRELSVQAANDTLSDTERAYIQLEIDQIKDEIGRYASDTPYLSSFQMDGSFIKYELTDGDGAITPTTSLFIHDSGKFSQYVGKELRIDILQDATTQEVADASLTSKHIQEVKVGVTGTTLRNTRIWGNSTGAKNDTLITGLTSGMYDPVNAKSFLRRKHDGGLISNNNYSISSALPIPKSTDFQIQLSNPSDAIYKIEGRIVKTNPPVGNKEISDTIIESFDAIQIEDPVKKVTGESHVSTLPAGTVTVNKVPAEFEKIMVTNPVAKFYGEACSTVFPGSGEATLSQVNVVHIQEVRVGASPIASLADGNDGDTVYYWDGSSNKIKVGKKSGGAIIPDASYNISVDYYAKQTGVVEAKKLSVGADGDTVYYWDNTSNTINIGVKQSGSVSAYSTHNVTIDYYGRETGWFAGVPLANGNLGETVYTFDKDNRTITVGRKNAAGNIEAKFSYNAKVDYHGWEDGYQFDYQSYNKYEITDGTKNGGVVQMAEDLYDNTNVPGDHNGRTALEVRINNVLQSNYTYFEDYNGYKNILVFDESPAVGDNITVDYATPVAQAVDWTKATLGESTNSDGSITVGEANAKDGIFNDFWDEQDTRTITIRQPGRNKKLELEVEPSWTPAELIDKLNEAAYGQDVELVAYWENGQVRVKPGTTGWKKRPITGWEGSYFRLENAALPEYSNIGPGGNGDRREIENQYAIKTTTPAQDSRIRITLVEDGTVLSDHQSTWNHHVVDDIGLTIDIRKEAGVGSYSTFFVTTPTIQAGPNAYDNIDFSLPNISVEAIGLDAVDASTREGAFNSIGIVDNAIKRLSSNRAYFGSMINRFEHAFKNLQCMNERISESESVIRDADFATEISIFTKRKILQESTTAMLSQANFRHRQVLSLFDNL